MRKPALLLIIVLLTAFPVQAQEGFDSAFDELDQAFEESASQEEQAWDQANNSLDEQWEKLVKQTEAEWERLREEVEKKWDEFYYSTNKEWVDYDEDKNTRSRVNFEKGEIEVSVLVPVKEPSKSQAQKIEKKTISLTDLPKPVIAQAEKRLEKQVKKIFSPDNPAKQEALKDQVEYTPKKTVTPQNAVSYYKKQLAPKLKLSKKIIKSKDGKKRLKLTVKIKMVPDHLKIRLDRYKQLVIKYAEKYQLDPALMFAVIHTESSFNPLAKSWVPAYGLMQLVPRFAALDAYIYLYDKKKILEAGFLYNPENNIMLGAVYLHLLQKKYFVKVQKSDNRRSLMIAAYNCGPTRITKKIVNKFDVDKMENKQLVELIRKSVPQETKEYILKVQSRITLYRRI